MEFNEYLHKEYELCYEQLRFYDDRHNSMLNYLFSLTSAVATAQFVVFEFLKGPTRSFFVFQVFLSAVVFIATLILYLAMIQNRLYFIFVARQINAIRGYLMKTEAPGFTNNQLYTSSDFSALKASSVHSFQMIGAALISSLFAGLTSYALCPALGIRTSMIAPLLSFTIVFLSELLGGASYLMTSSKKTSDQAIHGAERIVVQNDDISKQSK